jgi:Na+/glutamate symporter
MEVSRDGVGGEMVLLLVMGLMSVTLVDLALWLLLLLLPVMVVKSLNNDQYFVVFGWQFQQGGTDDLSTHISDTSCARAPA